MAFKTHINDATGNQPGQTTTFLTAALSEGVHNLARTDFKVTGTAGLGVVVAKGEAFVENDAYVYGTMDQKFFSVASSGTVSASIASNSSGNPRIDVVCLKVDTAATPGVQGVASSSIAVIQGTASATPAVPTIPNNHLALAHIAVANGASVISSGEITDVRVQATFNGNNLGWMSANESWTYASATTITVPTDATAKYRVGDKIRIFQAGAAKYFIVVTVAATLLTITGGSSYTLTNAVIYNPMYSRELEPFGWPAYFTFTNVITVSGGTAPSYGNTNYCSFNVHGRHCYGSIALINTSGGTAGASANPIQLDLPITPAIGNNNQIIGSVYNYNNTTGERRHAFYTGSGAKMYFQDTSLNLLSGDGQNNAARRIFVNFDYTF